MANKGARKGVNPMMGDKRPSIRVACYEDTEGGGGGGGVRAGSGGWGGGGVEGGRVTGDVFVATCMVSSKSVATTTSKTSASNKRFTFCVSC